MKTKTVFAFDLEPGDKILVSGYVQEIAAVLELDKHTITTEYKGGGFGIKRKLSKQKKVV